MISRETCDAQDAPDFGRRREPGFDGRAGAFPAIDHTGGDGGFFELADVCSGEDGPGNNLGLGKEELGEQSSPEIAGAAAQVAAAWQPGVAHG